MSTAVNVGPYVQKDRSSHGMNSAHPGMDGGWYAAFTTPKHEKSVLRYLDVQDIETFLPTFETTRVWKNRQRVKLAVPLFPCYVFIHADSPDFGRVLRCPGLIRLIGNQRGPLAVPNSAIEMLRIGVAEKRIQPYRELAVGKKVRVKNGAMRGVEGVLIRKANGWRFVLSIDSINQCAAIEIEAEDLELIAGGSVEESSFPS